MGSFLVIDVMTTVRTRKCSRTAEASPFVNIVENKATSEKT